MGDIVNKNDRCSKPENELDNYSSQCSSVDKSISDFIKSVESIKKDSTTSLKYSSRDSGSSDEMHITTSSFKNKNKIKMSPIYKKTSCNNRKNINSQLYSSTPLSNSEHSVNGITEHISKRIEQLQKHLVKSSAGKLSIKQLKKYEKDINSSNQKKFKSDSDKKKLQKEIHFKKIVKKIIKIRMNILLKTNLLFYHQQTTQKVVVIIMLNY
ncbi:Hypothetical protein CINCED_3A024638 [Cinara cedri]|uniref:Uncharacterized protein n=1 Tax=Cinara cedri TaxID=506608 RepID=A0A5E4MWV9_9HEMI|nr:Hypothetical protein CINCED_3A024638 [Cinara cedri]